MKMKLWIYEIHTFELRNEKINVKKILAVINPTYAVAKRKPEKNQSCQKSYIHNLIFIVRISDVRPTKVNFSRISLSALWYVYVDMK